MLKEYSISDFIQLLFLFFLSWLTVRTLRIDVVVFLNNLDLVFHEAGHTLAFFFGDFLRALGGTLAQLFVPLIFALYFASRYNVYASAVLFWWFGENLINISIYVGDARAQLLPLLGPKEGHDWAYLLGRMNILAHDTLIADVFFILGATVMLGALLLAFTAIYRRKAEGNSRFA